MPEHVIRYESPSAMAASYREYAKALRAGAETADEQGRQILLDQAVEAEKRADEIGEGDTWPPLPTSQP